jgi:putative transcriptional regulator
LEEEISRNGWLTVDAASDIIFDTPVEQRYDKALSLLGVERSFLMSEAGHA